MKQKSMFFFWKVDRNMRIKTNEESNEQVWYLEHESNRFWFYFYFQA
jgi:hypothetical protein